MNGVSVNLLGVVEHPSIGDSPYRINADGEPYLPVGDGGVVLGVRLGDSVFAAAADHAAPGACLVHPDDAARHALLLYGCIGNHAVVRTGAAAGATSAILGKRGDPGRLITGFETADLVRLRPGDQVSVQSFGQGVRPDWLPATVSLLNLDPDLLPALPIGEPTKDEPAVQVSVRAVLPAKLAGNGLGRPAAAWDLDLQVNERDADTWPLRLGDLVAIADIDARYNLGYRRGWLTIGVIGHGSSPLPGHGPGMTVILTGPASALRAQADNAGHIGLTASMLMLR